MVNVTLWSNEYFNNEQLLGHFIDLVRVVAYPIKYAKEFPKIFEVSGENPYFYEFKKGMFTKLAKVSVFCQKEILYDFSDNV